MCLWLWQHFFTFRHQEKMLSTFDGPFSVSTGILVTATFNEVKVCCWKMYSCIQPSWCAQEKHSNWQKPRLCKKKSNMTCFGTWYLRINYAYNFLESFIMKLCKRFIKSLIYIWLHIDQIVSYLVFPEHTSVLCRRKTRANGGLIFIFET